MPRWARRVLVAVLIAVAIVVLFTWVFPWVEAQQQDPTMGLGATPAAVATPAP